MAGAKTSKVPNKQEEEENLKSEVASFAASIGLASSAPPSGFDDSDFRKTGPLQPTKLPKKPRQAPENKSVKNGHHNSQPSIDKEKPRPKPAILSLDDSTDKLKASGKFKNLPKLPLVKASSLGVWYVDAAELESKVIGEQKRVGVKNAEDWKKIVEKKRELGEKLMAQYTLDYESTRGQSGDIKMLITTQRSGTAADKVSAFSVLVGDNPISNLRSLDGLVGMVTSKVGKRHALTGFEALMELFISSLLPDHKLKNLLQQPLDRLPETKDGYSLLLFWYWEECLKQRYERFIFALEEASRDLLPVLKQKALKTIYILLKSKSEQERRLLSALVNKLGDPETKSASNADFHLSNLLSDHPNMKGVVIDEVDSFLFRPHLGLRAKYHAVNFLSQIRLSQKGDGPRIAKRLVDVYFALFKVLITEAFDKKNNKSSKEVDGSKSGHAKNKKTKKVPESHFEMDSRLLSVLLTGVNRAFPFVSSSEVDDIIEVQTPMLFQLVHSKSFNVTVQALMLLDKISSKNQVVSDRFYRALYSKLLLPAALNSSKAEMFFGLLLRAMKGDVNLKRVAAFAKRLLQLALQQPPQYACGCLFLLSEVLKARPPLWNLMLQNESVDEEIEYFEDIIEDAENKNQQTTEPVTGSDDARLVHSKDTDSESDLAEEENASSPASSSEDDVSEEEGLLIRKDSKVLEKFKVTSGEKEQQPSTVSKKSLLPGGYDPRHSEPSLCNADQVSWWEMVVLASNVHPSVATMARTLLSGANIVYNGNPLNDLSLTSFLDKFMEKKPKASTWHGGSQIEPAKKLDMENHLVGPEILSLAEVDVPPEDLVFHKFYTYKMNSSTKTRKKKKKSAEMDAAEGLSDIVGDDESDNEEIENVLDSANLSDGDYDYDDLDQVANEEDEDLVDGVSDGENGAPTDSMDGQDFDFGSGSDDVLSEGDGDVNIGDVDDEIDAGEERFDERKRKRKTGKGVSPFASLEEYEHLLKEDSSPDPDGKVSAEKRRKTRKKRRSCSK